MTASRPNPARSSVLLGAAVVGLTVSAGVGAGLLAQAIAPEQPVADAETQGLVQPPDDDATPQDGLGRGFSGGPTGVAPPVDDPPPRAPTVRRVPSRRPRTRMS